MQPSSERDWAFIRHSMLMQAQAVRREWPRLRAVLLRTQYETTYRWYKTWANLGGEPYVRYSELMRELAARSRQHAAQLRTGLPCGGVHVLDLARMTNATPMPRERWSTDGLHPAPFVAREYTVLTMNVLADLAEACVPHEPHSNTQPTAAAPRL